MCSLFKRQEKLNIILGAGFSFDAGLPLVKGLDNKFNRDNVSQFLRFYDSQWGWKENHEEVDQGNGDSCDAIVIGYIFNEILNDYKSATGGYENYEDYYSYISTKPEEWFDIIRNKAIAEFESFYSTKFPTINPREWSCYDHFSRTHLSDVHTCFQYLVAEPLRPQKSENELKAAYSNFFAYISKYDIIKVFTLNHDLEFERILKINEQGFSDGFSLEGSLLKNDDGKVKSYNGEFSSKINIYKLHGSIDLLGYPEANKNAQGAYVRTGNKIYCKSSQIHFIQRIDEDGNAVQDFNLEPEPKFLTGKSKPDLIKNDDMYADLFSKFEEELALDNDLLVIGYSFSDEHINDVLKTSRSKKIINVNPNKEYPFDSTAINIEYQSDLK